MTAEPTEIHAPVGAPEHPRQPPAQPPKKQKKDRGRVFNWLTDKGAPLLAAILTVVASLLGIWGAKVNKENDELAADVSALKDQRSVLGEDNEDLTAELADMTTSRDMWKERAEAAAKTPDTTPPTTVDPEDPDAPPGEITPGAAGIFRQTGATPVTIAASYGIDLDTRDVNWGVNTSGGDLYFYRSGSDYVLAGTDTVALVDQEATFDDCEAQTVLQARLTKEQTVVGRQFCTKTNEDRWAYVKIIGLDTERGTITLHVVVYTLQTD